MDDRKDGRTVSERPFRDEVEHPETAGRQPTAPDDKGDPKRQDEAPKTTQRQE